MNQKLVIGNRFSFSNRNKAALSIETNKNSTTTTTTTTTELEPSSPPSSTSASDSSNNQQQQQQQQLTNPTSSLAARIGNVMVDPYNPSSSTLLSHKAGVGAGAFVYKVYNMLLDPAFQHLISFNPNGQSFTVNNVQDFSKTVLPKQFKHNNFSSFVRQLNMYGFHKVNKTPRGQRGNDNSAAWEFVHPKFHRGRPDLLEQIRRKTLENDSASHSLRHKDHHHHHHHHQAFINQSSPTTTQRFPLDPATAFLPTVQHPHPNFQPLVPHNTRLFFPHLQQQPSSSQSESQPELSPAGPTASFNLPDLSSNPTLPSSSLFEGSPHPTITPNNNTADHSLHEFQSSHHYTHSFPQSSYPIDPPSSSHSHVSSAPITPLSAVPPPPSSPMDMNLDPNVFAKEPLETLADVKHQMSGHFQGINASYEALYQELHETRRRQGVLIDLVEKMYKTLQSTPNTNIGYEFPSRDLLGAETTPIFKITEHNHPDHFPMVYEDINSQQHCSVSVGTSPSVSEFSHAAQTSPCHSTFRSLSVGPAGFAGFGNLTLASYPNSPVGARINDQHQTNTTGTNSPPSVMQNHQGGGPSLMDDGANRFLVPSLSSSHHPQQVLGNSNNNNNNNNDINSAPVSPRAVLSAAMKTPLPPSPAPFKQIIQAASGQAEMKATQRTDEYHQAMDSFLHLHHHHHHHAGLSIGGLKEAAASSTFAAAPPSIEPTHLPTHAEECIHLGPGGDRSQAFDRLVVSPSPDNLVFASSTSPPSLVHLHHPPPHPTGTPNHHHRRHRHQQQQYPQQHHHPQASAHPSHHLLPSSEENAIAVCLAPLADPCLSSAAAASSATLPLASPATFKGKKRPASGSIDLPSSSSASLENRLPIIPPN